jgi:hypothetical protein
LTTASNSVRASPDCSLVTAVMMNREIAWCLRVNLRRIRCGSQLRVNNGGQGLDVRDDQCCRVVGG